MATDPTAPPFLTRLGRAFRNLLIFAVLLAGATGGLYAMSLLNARTWTLAVAQGQLVVRKGKLLPMGSAPFVPGDPLLAEAYAPLDLNGNTALAVVGQHFEDRDELDRALFSVIELLAKPRVASDDKRDLEVGIALVKRAQALRGLSEEQRKTLSQLHAEVAYFLARQRLDESRKQLDDAVLQLKLAADADARHKKDATQMLLAVEPQVKLLSDVLRAAAQGLPLPTSATGEPKSAAAVDPKPDAAPPSPDGRDGAQPPVSRDAGLSEEGEDTPPERGSRSRDSKQHCRQTKQD